MRSMYTDLPSHPQAIIQTNIGRIIPGHPSMGSWLTYGLGTENRNLPGFIAMCPGMPNVGPQLWSSAFLPADLPGHLRACNESDPEKMIQHLVNRQAQRCRAAPRTGSGGSAEQAGPGAQRPRCATGRPHPVHGSGVPDAGRSAGCVRYLERDRSHPAALRYHAQPRLRRSRSIRPRATATSPAAA